MEQQQIHDTWGSVIRTTPDEFFAQPIDYWRNLLYDRKLIVLKQMDFTPEQYAMFSLQFGRPWMAKEYVYSLEARLPIETPKGLITVSPFSNKISPRLGMKSMIWHSDIPNRQERPFPFRSLWSVSNPNAESGLTSWMNLEEGIDHLSPRLKDLIPRTRIIQQSWYQKGTDIQEFDAIKYQPITGRPSLRLNYYNSVKDNITEAWILKTQTDGVDDPECSFVRDCLAELEQVPQLLYTHKWDVKDVVIYDNWTFVHSRTALQFDPTLERLFYRMNIEHLPNDEWADHKQRYALT